MRRLSGLGVLLDFTPASLAALDGHLATLELQGGLADGGPPTSDQEDLLLSFGSYVGETIRKRLGGDWQDLGGDGEIGARIRVTFSDDAWATPLAAVQRQLSERSGLACLDCLDAARAQLDKGSDTGDEAADWARFAAVLVRANRLDTALRLFRRATALAPGQGTLWASRGEVEEKLGLRDDARSSYTTALAASLAGDARSLVQRRLDALATPPSAPPEPAPITPRVEMRIPTMPPSSTPPPGAATVRPAAPASEASSVPRPQTVTLPFGMPRVEPPPAPALDAPAEAQPATKPPTAAAADSTSTVPETAPPEAPAPEAPPAAEAPAPEPPAPDVPPVAEPPVPETPPVAEPPAPDVPPVAEPPAPEAPPAAEAPAVTETPAAETPPAEAPAVTETPVAETPAPEAPAVTETPAAETPPAEAPAVTETPVAGTPPAEAPPVAETPAAEAPPDAEARAPETPPAAEARAPESPSAVVETPVSETPPPAPETPAPEAPQTPPSTAETPAPETPAPETPVAVSSPAGEPPVSGKGPSSIVPSDRPKGSSRPPPGRRDSVRESIRVSVTGAAPRTARPVEAADPPERTSEVIVDSLSDSLIDLARKGDIEFLDTLLDESEGDWIAVEADLTAWFDRAELLDVEAKRAACGAAMVLAERKGFRPNARPDEAAPSLRILERASLSLGGSLPPPARARLMLALAAAISDHAVQDPSRNQEEALQLVESTLSLVDARSQSDLWGRANKLLGNIQLRRAGGPRREHVDAALGAFRAALRVFSPATSPEAWAALQIDLGHAIRLRAGDRDRNTEQAIECFSAALTVLSRDKTPLEWGLATLALGQSLLERNVSDRAATLERAITALRGASEVLLPGMPEAATAHYKLALAFQRRKAGARAENLEEAVRHYELALPGLEGQEAQSANENLEAARRELAKKK